MVGEVFLFARNRVYRTPFYSVTVLVNVGVFFGHWRDSEKVEISDELGY